MKINIHLCHSEVSFAAFYPLTESMEDPRVREKLLAPEEFSFNILPYEVGTTPLHLAAKRNHIECVKVLFDQGVDYNAADEKGQTSLYLAAKGGLPECVMLQLKNAVGFPILSIPTKENETALHECLRHGGKMKECVKELVRHGADVSFPNAERESAVHLAVRFKWSMAMIKLLVLEGYGMDFDRQKYRTPLTQLINQDQRLLRRQRLQRFQGNGGENSHKVTSSSSRNEKLAVFFLRMGATRESLRELLWDQLNFEEPGGRVLETLMDSFAYLPPFPRLQARRANEGNDPLSQDGDDPAFSIMDELRTVETEDDGQLLDDTGLLPVRIRQRLYRPSLQMRRMQGPEMVFQARGADGHTLDNTDLFPVPERRNVDPPLLEMNPELINPYGEAVYRDPLVRHPRNRGFFGMHRTARTRGSRNTTNTEEENSADDMRVSLRRTAGASAQNQSRQRDEPPSAVEEKQQTYLKRSRKIPSLAHLSRISVRNTLQAEVRKVLSFPVPNPLKEYILLGYQLSDDEDEDQEFEEIQEEEEEESISQVRPLLNAPTYQRTDEHILISLDPMETE
ncbi:uncharacterized protein LOC143278271 [Babylonia areolata]|uniref:uncharacterized protein LOC143278271 n=1 Tax=Babylonia areolata TaxID=304850 RepID=UPI003FD022B3